MHVPNKQSKEMVWLYAVIGVLVGLFTLAGGYLQKAIDLEEQMPQKCLKC